MKKSKIIPLKTEQLNDQLTLKKISEAFDSLDSIDFENPSQKWFEQFVIEQQRIAKEKWRKELVLFIFIAAIILGGIVFSLLSMPIIFIVLQAMGLVTIVIYSTVYIMKQVKTNEQ